MKRSVVTIDYSLHQITFTKPESFLPPFAATKLPQRFASITEIMMDASFAIGPLTPSVTHAAIMLSKTGAGAEEYVAGTIGSEVLRRFSQLFPQVGFEVRFTILHNGITREVILSH